jgi:hypothetical protein
MSTLDIRDGQERTITKIKFSAASDDHLSDFKKSLSGSGSYLVISLSHNRIDYSDIDNFILALEKAKELWAK